MFFLLGKASLKFSILGSSKVLQRLIWKACAQYPVGVNPSSSMDAEATTLISMNWASHNNLIAAHTTMIDIHRRPQSHTKRSCCFLFHAVRSFSPSPKRSYSETWSFVHKLVPVFATVFLLNIFVSSWEDLHPKGCLIVVNFCSLEGGPLVRSHGIFCSMNQSVKGRVEEPRKRKKSKSINNRLLWS